MSTSPKSNQPEELLTQLLSLADGLLACGEHDIKQMKHYMDERDALIKRLEQLKPEILKASTEGSIPTLLDQLQAKDREIETHFQTIHAKQAERLRDIFKGKQALSRYKIPYIPPP
jgi:hypothetical protein